MMGLVRALAIAGAAGGALLAPPLAVAQNGPSGLGATTYASGEVTQAQCKQAYDAVFAAIKESRESEVSDFVIGWALDYEKKVNEGGGCTRIPTGLVKAAAAPVSAPKLTFQDMMDRAEGQRQAGNMDQAIESWKLLCSSGEPAGCHNAAYALDQRAPTTSAQLGEITDLYKRACNNASGPYKNSCLNLAVHYNKKGAADYNPQTAAEYFERTCHLGGPPLACFNAGVYWRQQASIAKTTSERGTHGQRGIDLYRKACDRDEAAGCAALGKNLISGSVVQADYLAGLEAYRKGCRLAPDGDICAETGFWLGVVKKACDKGERSACQAAQTFGARAGES